MTKRRFRSESPVPPVAAGGSNAPTHSGSAESDRLASIIKILDIAGKAADGLPIYGATAVISSIRTVLQSVKVRLVCYSGSEYRLFMQYDFLSNLAIIRGRLHNLRNRFVSSRGALLDLFRGPPKYREL